MKKIIVSIFITLICCGCWNKVELNDYAIVTGISVDYIDEEYVVSVLISNSPKNSSESSSKTLETVIYKGKGNSMYEAIKNIGLKSPKELYIEHLSVLIVSEDVAKNGLNSMLDFFVREPTAKNQFYFILSKECKASDVLEILSPLSDFESQNVAENIDSSSRLQGSIKKTDFNQLILELVEEGIHPTINGIIIYGDSKEGSEKESLESSTIKNYIKLDTIGVFKGDKLITWATKEESKGINLISGDTLETFETIEYEDGEVIVGTETFDSKIDIELKNNKPSVTINISGYSVIHEVDADIDLESNKVMDEIEKEFEKKLKSTIKEAVKLAQENKTDIFGFGNLFYKDHYKYYQSVEEKWHEEIFPKMDIKINIDVKLESKGSAESTLERNENET